MELFRTVRAGWTTWEKGPEMKPLVLKRLHQFALVVYVYKIGTGFGVIF